MKRKGFVERTGLSKPTVPMDVWKYYDIVHRHHKLMNPVDTKKIEELYTLLDLKPDSNVVDIGCGKGEMLIRLAEDYRVEGAGIDKSPYCIREAEKQRLNRVPRAGLKFLEMDGARYKTTDDPADLAMCIGATWIYGGYNNTLTSLSNMAKPNGLVMVGEPFWRSDPPKDYLESESFSRELFSTHYGNVVIGEKVGLTLAYTLVSSEADWDTYEGLHWFAASEYSLSRPKDPDLKDLLARVSKEKHSYLRHGRDVLGWAIYLFRNTRLED